jgi:hypothetical protein
VQKGYGDAQSNLNEMYAGKELPFGLKSLPALPGTMNDQTESVMNKTGELMNTKVGDLADKGKRFVNTNYPNAVSDVKNAGNRLVDDFKLGVKGIGSNMLGANGAQPITQVKNPAQPAASNQPVANMPIGDNAQLPASGVAPQPNVAPEAPVTAPISITQKPQPYSTRLGNMGDNVNTLNVAGGAGKGQMQFADGRSLMPEQAIGLQATLAREADPAWKAKLANEAAIVNKRMAWAKQNDLERNARLGNPAAAVTLKTQADTQQAQLGAQVESNKLAQDKELKQMELRQPKPITTNTYSSEGTLTGQDVGVVQYDKEGNPVLKKLSQNADDKDYAEFSSFTPEERDAIINNAQKVLSDPKNPKYANALKIATMYQRLLQSQNQQ